MRYISNIYFKLGVMKDRNKITIILVVSMVVVTMCTLAGFGMVRLFTSQYSDIPTAFGSLTTYGGIFYDINQRVNVTKPSLPTPPDTIFPNYSSSSSSSEYGKVIMPEEITKVCTQNELFPAEETGIMAAKDMLFPSPLEYYEPYNFEAGINLNYVILKDQDYPTFEIIVNKKCKYPLTNYLSSKTNSVVDVYYSYNERKVYFLSQEYLESGSKENAKLKLIKYDPQRQAVESTHEFSLPIAHDNFFPYQDMDGGYDNSDVNLDAQLLLTGSMYDVSTGKLYLSIQPRRACLFDYYKCYFENSYNALTKKGADTLSGVYEIDKSASTVKRVYGPKLITADGILTKVEIVALAEYNEKTQYDEFKIFFRDVREKITAP